MANKKPYTIRTASDGIVSVTFAGLTEMFKTREVVNSFALELSTQLSDRRTGKFHLQDMPDGRLALIMHKTNHTIYFKDYDQASMFAEMLFHDTIDEQWPTI
jgi:hypothetical protein